MTLTLTSFLTNISTLVMTAKTLVSPSLSNLSKLLVPDLVYLTTSDEKLEMQSDFYHFHHVECTGLSGYPTQGQALTKLIMNFENLFLFLTTQVSTSFEVSCKREVQTRGHTDDAIDLLKSRFPRQALG